MERAATIDSASKILSGDGDGKDSPLDFLQPPSDSSELGWLENYRILQKLGEGGMGIVLRAEDVRLKRSVALKVIRPELAGSQAARQRFLREAQAMASINHDNVITIYQVGLAKGAQPDQEVPFLAMPLLEGESLDSFLHHRGPLHMAEVARIGSEIAEGLAAAHARGLIHRDIKPGNIFLERPRDRVKILDFGLARATSSELHLSASGQVIGTPYFMAPEQARGDSIDSRADLFSLGCVLYAVLAGHPPFEGSSLMAVLTKLAVEEPAPLNQAAPGTPLALAELVHRLLTKSPGGRPDSAATVAQELRAIEAECESHNDCAQPTIKSQRSTPTPLPDRTCSTLTTAVPVPPGPTQVAPSKGWNRRQFLWGAGAALLGAGGYFGQAWWNRESGPTGEPIRVGILHSQTGTMRESEIPVLEMTQLALDEINEQGGLLRRPIQQFVRNGASDERIFAREAERLILQDQVCVIFGCWTSASRKAVKEVVEQHRNLLVYPVQYEGVESSPHILYTGATPNQQLLPAVDWCLQQKPGAKFFLVGSDYIFPRTAHAILRHRIEERGGQVVGDEYLPLGSIDTRRIPEAIKSSRPDFILNTVNGTTNLALFNALRDAEIRPQDVPTVSFSLDEQTLQSLDPRVVAGDYAAWNYFASIPGPVNEDFVRRYQNRWGDFKVVTDPMEAAYLGVTFWAQAVKSARTEEVNTVRLAIGGQSHDAPEGPSVHVDPENQHTWKYFYLGQITPEGRIRIVQRQNAPLPPEPYPKYRTPAQWESLQRDFYMSWGNRWSRPG